MKNKVKFKKYLRNIVLITIILSSLFLLLTSYEYHIYTKNFNKKIESIVAVLQNKYPNLSELEIIEILNSKENTDILKKYGLTIKNNSIILENTRSYHFFLILNSIVLGIGFIILILIFIIYNNKREKEILDITHYIEEINEGNYELKIDSISEDELSILKNEIYKTTIMLKEAVLNSNQDKLNLKKSLEDISHQLKTPITSILVILDNLIDNEDMDIETRNDFIRDIKREVININFLVQAILKLSKFDANTIDFIKKNVKVQKIIDESIKNVSILCDLRNIKIIVKGDSNITLKCDLKWQTEALTNVLKNAIEHSLDNKSIEIDYEENNAYVKISIKDFGKGISKKDLKHIFERFYKGENARDDSIGIGLALSKSIIEEDNGVISVESLKNETCFIIKYFK